MKLLVVLAVVTLTHGALLDLSQVLWSKVLDGGYRKVGRVDPLFVPVIKVDQSEGNMTYRVILRNLQVTGLNQSTIESVHIVKGKLKSNLSDSEAGYVSYNEQRGMDSIRYRFHTLVKEPKGLNSELEQRATEQFERIVQFDPMATRASEQQDLLKGTGIGGQRTRSGVQQNAQGDKIYTFGDMRVVVNSTPRTPSQIRLAISNNYGSAQASNIRPCIGACKPSYLQQQQGNVRTRVNQNQRYADQVAGTPESTTASYSTTSQRSQNLLSVKGGGNSGTQFSGNFGNTRFQASPNQFYVQAGSNQFQQTQQPTASNAQNPNQFSIPGDNQFQLNQQTQQTAVPGDPNQFSISAGFGNNQQNADKGGSGISGVQYSDSFGQSGNPFRGPAESDYATGNYQTNFNSNMKEEDKPEGYYYGNFGEGPYAQSYANIYGPVNEPVQYGNEPIQLTEMEYRYLCEGQPLPQQYIPSNFNPNQQTPSQPDFNVQQTSSPPDFNVQQTSSPLDFNVQQTSSQLNVDPGLKNRIGARPTTPTPMSENFEPYKPPLIRIEKQPGYVDIVYASENKQTSESRQSENIKAAPGTNSSRPIGFIEIIRDLNGNQRYIIRNFTEGESLRKRNDAVRVAAQSKQIKDMTRYAMEYQENQGYFEEGMELIYHFGPLNETDKSANETLARRKRQQMNDTEEEDVMHVIVRMKVPKLGIKSNYALLGQVGRQPVRGAGLLEGNFTDVTADFTVELKKVNNQTMVVRAARAKLVSKDRNIKLQGMDERGPVSRILSHGLLAAEAVAAMIVDDLASKALNEGNNEAMIYKMYKNLPVIQKA